MTKIIGILKLGVFHPITACFHAERARERRLVTVLEGAEGTLSGTAGLLQR